MIILIDNYDSFSYNLYQYVGAINPEIKVIRNDALTVEEIDALTPTHIILSPGPGQPKDAGICEELIRKLKGKYPILGVCLGHQAICEAFGGKIVHAPKLMHGKTSQVKVDTASRIFNGLKESMEVARYHSLIAEKGSLPVELIVIGETKSGEIMAVEHEKYPIFGLQFHPESVLTKDGMGMIRNFLTT